MGSTTVNYERILWTFFFTIWGKHPVYDEIDWGARLLLHGPPGSRKTSICRQLAKVLGVFFYSLKPGARGQGGFGVTPVPTYITDPDGQQRYVLTFPGPDWIAQIGTKPALVLCDEMNTAAPALQAPLLGFTQEKEMGSEFMHGRTRVFGATNSVEDAAGGWDLAPAIANRLGHIDWPDPEVDDWSAWLLSGASGSTLQAVNIDAEEARVLEAWPTGWAKAAGLVASFLKRRQSLMRVQPPSGTPAASRAWPSPRSWEYATRMLTAAMVHDLNETETNLVMAAYIGEAAAAEFGIWMLEQDLPDPVALLEGTETFKHNPVRLDRTAAVLNACSALVTPKDAKDRGTRAKKLWCILDECITDVVDVCVPVAMALWDAGLDNFKEATPVMAKCKPLLNATKKQR